MDLLEARKKLPQYDNLSDYDFIRQVHQEYYPDLEFDDVAESVGFTPSREGNLGTDLMYGLTRGLDVTGETIGGFMEYAGIPGGTAVKNLYRERGAREEIQKPEYLREGTIADHPERVADPRWWASTIGEQAPLMATMMSPGVGIYRGAKAANLGLNAATKLATGGAAVGSFGVEVGAAYNDAKDEMLQMGYDKPTAENIARKEATAVGITNALLETLPFGNLLKNPGNKKLLARAIRQGLLEGGTEAIQENVNMLAAELGHNPNRATNDIIGRTVESFLVGGVMGGGLGMAYEGGNVQKPQDIDMGLTPPSNLQPEVNTDNRIRDIEENILAKEKEVGRTLTKPEVNEIVQIVDTELTSQQPVIAQKPKVLNAEEIQQPTTKLQIPEYDFNGRKYRYAGEDVVNDEQVGKWQFQNAKGGWTNITGIVKRRQLDNEKDIIDADRIRKQTEEDSGQLSQERAITPEERPVGEGSEGRIRLRENEGNRLETGEGKVEPIKVQRSSEEAGEKTMYEILEGPQKGSSLYRGALTKEPSKYAVNEELMPSVAKKAKVNINDAMAKELEKAQARKAKPIDVLSQEISAHKNNIRAWSREPENWDNKERLTYKEVAEQIAKDKDITFKKESKPIDRNKPLSESKDTYYVEYDGKKLREFPKEVYDYYRTIKPPPPPEVTAEQVPEKPAEPAKEGKHKEAEPPVPKGMTRLYHGSATPGRTTEKAWFSTNKEYAKNYREGAELQYVDYPTEKVNAALDPDNYGQTVEKGFTWNVELDSTETGERKVLQPTPAEKGEGKTKAKESDIEILKNLAREYIKQGLPYGDFQASLKGVNRNNHPYMGGVMLKTDKLKADLKKEGFDNLPELWASLERQSQPKQAEEKPAAQDTTPKTKPGKVYLDKGGVKPFFEYKEITRGKVLNKGKYRVTLTNGKTVIVNKEAIREFPSAQEDTGDKPVFLKEGDISIEAPIGKILLSKQGVENIIKGVKTKLPNIGNFEVVKTQDELPEFLFKEQERDDSRIYGVYDPQSDTFYLVADNMKNRDAVLNTVIHEAIGHRGVDAILPKSRRKQLFRMVNFEYGKKDIGEKIIKDYKLDMTNETDQVTFAREVIAHMAVNEPKASLLDRVISLIKSALRELGITLKISDAEIRSLLARSYKFAQTGKGKAGSEGLSYSQRPIADKWFSALERGVEGLKQEKATPEQWLGMIKKLAVKEEEMSWVGLEPWLKDQKGAVTKQAILDFIRMNNVQIEEVEKKQDQIDLYDEAENEVKEILSRQDLLNDEINDLFDEWRQSNYDKSVEQKIDDYLYDNDLDPLMSYAQQGTDKSTRYSLPKYSQWQLPGGENYRELLITMPEKAVQVEPVDTSKWRVTTVKENQYTGQRDIIIHDENRKWINRRSGFRGTDAEAIADAVRDRSQSRISEAKSKSNYKSSHWDEPNVMGHIRFNDRTGANGEKILFIEEIQSDWGQEGRKKGYKGDKEPKVKQFGISFGGNEPSLFFNTREEAQARIDQIQNDITEPLSIKEIERVARSGAKTEGVPDMPFKKSWPLTMFKRMVRYATENGYDSIAWTPGDVQADRYDLSKQVKEINYTKQDDNLYHISVKGLNGDTVLEGDYTPNQLEDYVGKDIAQKIVDGEGSDISGLPGAKSLKGDNLKVGGEGMKGFYDKILPAEVNKFFNKPAWGNAKVGTTSIEAGQLNLDKSNFTDEEWKDIGMSKDAWSIPITPEMRDKALTEGMPMFKRDKTDKRIMFSKTKDEGDNLFHEENKRIREQDKTLWNKASKILKRQFKPGGLLPQSVFDEMIARDSQFEVVEFDNKTLIANFEKQVKESYGKNFDKLPEETKKQLSEALAGKVDENLPENIKTAIYEMRQYIDKLSTEYSDILAKQSADLLEKDKSEAAAAKADLLNIITGNMGEYVHRSYQVFDDKTWFKKVPENVLLEAENYLKEQYEKQGETEKEAIRLAANKAEELLKTGTAYDDLESFIKESKLGAKDLSVLIKRKKIAPEIRALLGEYTDPRLNFAKTTTKMGRLIWNQKFLDAVKEHGINNFLFEEENKPLGATKKIAAEGSEVYSPLNGLWTYPEIEQAFKDALGKENMAQWYRTIIQLNGAVKFSKTVLSPTTAARNWQSAAFFAIANGHFDFTQIKHSMAGLKEYFTSTGNRGRLEYLKKLKSLGVVYDTPYAGEMMRLLEDATKETSFINDKLKIKGALRYAQKFYQYGDDFWKIMGFENEKNNLIKSGMRESEAEKEAAERIRNTYPTYSMVGKFVKSLRRFPLAGTFVSFPSEIIRTSINIMRYTAKDIKAGRKEMAMKRIAGMSLVAGMAYALQALSKSWFDVDDDEEEAVRKLAAPWNKNSNIFFTGRDEKGNIRYIDTSYLDPYNYWKRPFTAIMRDQDWKKKLSDSMYELLEPFFGTDITAGTIFEIAANKREGTGSKIWDSNDPPTKQLRDITNHLRKNLQPGVVSNVERTLKALKGERSASGQQYNIKDEAAAWVGYRFTTLDPKIAIYYRSFNFSDEKTGALKPIKSVLRDVNDVDREDIEDAYNITKEKLQNAYKDMYQLVQAARKSGVSNGDIRRILRLSNISKADINNLLSNKTTEWKPSKQLLDYDIRKADILTGKGAEVRKRYRILNDIINKDK